MMIKSLTIPLLLFYCFITMGCRTRSNMKVLIKMIDTQEQFFKGKIVADFVNENRSPIEVLSYNSVDSIGFELDRYTNQIGLVKVPFEKRWSLVRKDYILPLESFLNKEELDEFRNTYMLTSLGRSENKQYFIPRKFETRLMVYLKSKVMDAVLVWRKYQREIQEDLKRYNGVGLPAAYILESDPNEWNYYDVFVVGWVWAHTPYMGKISAKIAHRGNRYSGTSHRVIDRVFQCNGDSTSVVTLKGDAVVDAFHWEAVYAASGIYNKKMWKENWSSREVWKGFQNGEVFLSFMTQLDCFFIHGTGHNGINGYLTNPDDFGVATMPTGCSVELSSTGKIKRTGRKAITTGGWWWGIPKTTPDPYLSYKFARYITSMENQVQGCSRFGMIPVRKDVLSDMQMFFGGEWISEIYNVSFKQLMYNNTTIVPGHPRFNEIGFIYLDAWFDIVVGENWSDNRSIPDRTFIKRYISKKYIPLINKIN